MSFVEYAKYYDMIYKDKDYNSEVKFLNTIFEKYGERTVKKILEIGCGTGNYTKLLLEQGYDVTGIDISHEMLKIAKMKCEVKKFYVMGVKNMVLDVKFDACIGMFAVMSYMTDNFGIKTALKNVYDHLKDDGIFVFDVWNGLAVMRILPEVRVKEIKKEYTKIIRIAMPNLRSINHICEVNYKLLILNKKDNTYEEIDEKHVVRFFFPQEIKYLLGNVGFKILKICPFLDLNGKLDEHIWNMCVIAKKVNK